MYVTDTVILHFATQQNKLFIAGGSDFYGCPESHVADVLARLVQASHFPNTHEVLFVSGHTYILYLCTLAFFFVP